MIQAQNVMSSKEEGNNPVAWKHFMKPIGSNSRSLNRPNAFSEQKPFRHKVLSWDRWPSELGWRICRSKG